MGDTSPDNSNPALPPVYHLSADDMEPSLTALDLKMISELVLELKSNPLAGGSPYLRTDPPISACQGCRGDEIRYDCDGCGLCFSKSELSRCKSTSALSSQTADSEVPSPRSAVSIGFLSLVTMPATTLGQAQGALQEDEGTKAGCCSLSRRERCNRFFAEFPSPSRSLSPSRSPILPIRSAETRTCEIDIAVHQQENTTKFSASWPFLALDLVLALL